jgi:hypothetical protein
MVFRISIGGQVVFSVSDRAATKPPALVKSVCLTGLRYRTTPARPTATVCSRCHRVSAKPQNSETQCGSMNRGSRPQRAELSYQDSPLRR